MYPPSTAVSQLPLVSAPGRAVPRVSRRAPTAAGAKRTGLRPLERPLWACSAGLLLVVALKAPSESVECLAGALLIILAAVLPSYLWVRGRVTGLPLYPAFALTFIWSFAFPLISEQRIIVLFPRWNQFVGGLTVTAFLLLGTLVWYWVGRRPAPAPSRCWTMNESQVAPWLLLAMGSCVVWTIVYSAGWIQLPGGLDSLSRAVQMPIEVLSCFVLSYRMGSGKLAGLSRITFCVLLFLLLLANLPPLLLFVSMSLSGISMIAYVAGSKRLPWRVGIVALFVFGFLHAGKAEMRERHWHEDEVSVVSPAQYPTFLAEWMGISWDVLQHGEDDRGASLLERASLMHWLLYFEATSPDSVPFLNGASYAVIPRMLVPRIFDHDKPLATEGITIVGVHYGIVTREESEVVTIGFGLLNEAFANFGYFGVAGLAIVLGAVYGQVARWARGMPILSLRGLLAISIANYAIQTEYSATFYVTALLQSTAVLLLLAVLLMRPRPFNSATASLLD